MRLLVSSSILLALNGVFTFSLLAQASVLTQHNDNARTGLNASETLLTPTTVNSNYFGKLFAQTVDGPVYAQPLYLANVSITNKGVHNVVFIATQHDSIYAFDADDNSASINSAPLWHTSFINPAAGITPIIVGSGDVGPDCATFSGEIGIVGTPVIDASRGTLYLVTHTKEPLPPPDNATRIQVHRLHALDVSTGLDRSNSPVVISASVAGTGDDSTNGIVFFNPSREVHRSGLLLNGGIVYVAFASYCDNRPYHGWIMGCDALTLSQTGIFNTAPNGIHGGIWMGGAGLAADSSGAIYCITGDGTFDTSLNPTNFGDSILKLQGTNLAVLDYFAPWDQASLFAADADLGSGGAVLLPDAVGSTNHPHLLVGGGKDGRLFLLDRENMGHFNPANNSQVVQEVPLHATLFGLPAFLGNRLYIQNVGQPLKVFAVADGFINPTPLSQSSETVTFRGATPSISANGVTNGIVWLLAPTPTLGVTTLRAYDANDLTVKLYDSYTTMSANSSNQLIYVKFAVPTIANGKAYVGGTNSFSVLGLRPKILSIQRENDSGIVHLIFVSPKGGAAVIQVSEDLVFWTDVGSGASSTAGTFTFTDSQAAGRPTRFYRLR